MKIEVLGTGCSKCNTLADHVKAAVAEAGVTAEIVKVTDIAAIAGRGVLMTPALVIDGQVKTSGKVPSVAEIRQMLT
jgi:small redox-active disulfide protein 2